MAQPEDTKETAIIFDANNKIIAKGIVIIRERDVESPRMFYPAKNADCVLIRDKSKAIQIGKAAKRALKMGEFHGEMFNGRHFHFDFE